MIQRKDATSILHTAKQTRGYWIRVQGMRIVLSIFTFIVCIFFLLISLNWDLNNFIYFILWKFILIFGIFVSLIDLYLSSWRYKWLKQGWIIEYKDDIVILPRPKNNFSLERKKLDIKEVSKITYKRKSGTVTIHLQSKKSYHLLSFEIPKIDLIKSWFEDKIPIEFA